MTITGTDPTPPAEPEVFEDFDSFIDAQPDEEVEVKDEAEEEPDPEAEDTEEKPETEEEEEPEDTDGGDTETDEPEEETEEAEEEPEEKEAVLHTVKIDGQESQVTLEDLTKNYQLSSTSYNRMKEAAEREQGARRVIDNLTKDPFGTLMDLFSATVGDQAKAEQYLIQATENFLRPHIEERLAPPEQAERIRLERENARLRTEYEGRQRQLQAEGQERHAQAFIQRVQNEVPEAMRSAGLNPEIEGLHKEVEKLAFQEIAAAIRAGVELTTVEAVIQVKSRLDSLASVRVGSLSPDEFLTSHPELANKVRETQVNRAKKKQKSRKTPTQSAKARESSTKRRRAKKSEKAKPLGEVFDTL